VPSSASSTCGSTCGSSSWNNMPEEVPMPNYPLTSDDSGPDSPSTQK
jgi:hypothetical protein